MAMKIILVEPDKNQVEILLNRPSGLRVKEHKSSFEHGKLPPSGKEKAPLLFAESDGIWLRLQREKDKHGKQRKHYELKQWCGARRPDSPKQSVSFDLFQSKADCGTRASLPALEGPHASRLS